MNSGGRDNEIGSEYRARLGALLATAVLLADDLRHVGAPIDGTPVTIRAEPDAVVDDLLLGRDDGSCVYVQAKHTVRLSTSATSPFGKAVSQFIRAHREAPSGEPLVLAYSHGSEPLSALGRWFGSLRYAEPAVPSPKEMAAADRFSALLAALGWTCDEDTTALAKRIYLWEAEPRRGALYAVAMQRLTQVGVRVADRSDAFDCLTNRIRHLARRRAGDDLDALVGVLRRAGRIHLEEGQTSPVRAALLVTEYRQKLVRQGRSLSAFGVPAAVADVPLSEGDADVRVKLPLGEDENVPRETSLGKALRRRGRVVVLGGGGSGKSTALRVLAAELASQADGPLPLQAHWQDLWRHKDDLLAGLTAHAIRDLEPSDGALLDAALRRAFWRGETALLLDGLDEVRAGREKAAATMKRWLDQAPPDTEAVVATHPSATAAAGAFNWPHLTLAPPREAETTAQAVISATARQNSCSEAWLDARMAWIRERWRRDDDLSSTPLMVVLLATLAATADEIANLPTTRAAVLIAGLREVVERWEVGTRLDGHVEVGDLGRAQAHEALQRALFVLARAALIGDIEPRDTLRDEVQKFLGPMSEGRARACASDAEQFWVATGMFSFGESGVRAHPRPLAGAALVWEAIEECASAEALMRYRDTPAGWEVLSLLSLERPDVMSSWVENVSLGGSVDELIAVIDAHGDGASLANDEMVRVTQRALSAVADDIQDLSRTVEALLTLDLPPQLVQEFRKAPDLAVSLREHPVIESALLVRSPNITERDRNQLRAFFLESRPDTGRDDDGTLRIDTLDVLHLRTLQAVALHLIGHSRTDAELVASRLERLKTPGFPRRLRDAFHQAGHDDLADTARATPIVPRYDWSWFGDYAKATRIALKLVSKLAAERPLSLRESRRLDELADLWASMCFQWWLPRSVEGTTRTFEKFVHVVVTLGGFDTAALAGQALQVLRELEDDPDADDILHDAATRRGLTHWERVADCEGMVNTIVLLFPRVRHPCLGQLMRALGAAPCQAHAHDTLLSALPAMSKVWRLEAATVGLATAARPDELALAWAAGNDVRLRQAAAIAIHYLLRTNPRDGEKAAMALLDDPDRGVQVEAVRSIAEAREAGLPVSPAVVGKLTSIEAESRRKYLCLWCDAEVPAGKRACMAFDSSGPSFDAQLDRALGRTRPTASNLAQKVRDVAPRRRARSSRGLHD